MSSRPAEGCPAHASVMDLLDHDYGQVSAAFAGFETHNIFADRGGTITGDNPRRTDLPLYGKKLLPDYHVESSFTEPQQAYVTLCVAALTKLAHGKILGQQSAQQESLSSQIQSRFLGNSEAHLRFTWSLVQSTANVIDAFGSAHPNLTPVLDAMHKSGATTGGLVLAFGAAKHSLAFAVKGEENPYAGEYLARGSLARFFTGQHPARSNDFTHETWCPGDPFGRAIIREAGRAATVLASTPGVVEAYNQYRDIPTVHPEFMGEQIDNTIRHAIVSARPAG